MYDVVALLKVGHAIFRAVFFAGIDYYSLSTIIIHIEKTLTWNTGCPIQFIALSEKR